MSLDQFQCAALDRILELRPTRVGHVVPELEPILERLESDLEEITRIIGDVGLAQRTIASVVERSTGACTSRTSRLLDAVRDAIAELRRRGPLFARANHRHVMMSTGLQDLHHLRIASMDDGFLVRLQLGDGERERVRHWPIPLDGRVGLVRILDEAASNVINGRSVGVFTREHCA